MIENPKVDEEVEVQTSDDGPWRAGVIKQAPPETTFGAPWCQVQLDSGALCDFACGSEYIRRAPPWTPKKDAMVEVRLTKEAAWVPGTVREIAEDGKIVVHVAATGNTYTLPPTGYIRKLEPKPASKEKPARKQPSVSVWVRVKAEIDIQLPSPWNGEESHNDLVPIAKREAREHLEKHLPRGPRIIDIHTVQTSVVSETKEKP